MLSIKEFKELVKDTWGITSSPAITCHFKKLIPMTVNIDVLKNTFIYTGQRSIVEFRDALGNRHAVPFDSYICVYDLWSNNGTNASITIDGVKAQYNIWQDGKFDSGSGQVVPSNSPVTFATNHWQRFYILRYPNTKILNFD